MFRANRRSTRKILIHTAAIISGGHRLPCATSQAPRFGNLEFGAFIRERSDRTPPGGLSGTPGGQRRHIRGIGQRNEQQRVHVCSTRSPSARSVARVLTQSGRPVHFATVSRWRRDGWRADPSEHPLEQARADLESALPLVAGDPTTTIEDLLRNSPDRKQLEELSDADLLRKAARELLIAVCLAARALLLKPTPVLTKPAEMGVLMRALAECIGAATVAFGQARNMPST